MPEMNEYWSAHALEEYKGYLHDKAMQGYTYVRRYLSQRVI